MVVSDDVLTGFNSADELESIIKKTFNLEEKNPTDSKE
jgi:hypothetical protein